MLGDSANFATGLNAVTSVSFLIAAYFLRDFVQTVRDFMREMDKRVTYIEAHLELKPEARRKPIHRR